VPKRYVDDKIPIELADEIDKILEKKLLGYRCRVEFVVEARQRQTYAVQK